MTFDPFTATLEEAQAQSDPNGLRGAVLRWGAAQDVLQHRASLELNPIDGIARCVRADLIAPDWLAAAFLRQYDKVLNCHVGKWDEAFGPAHRNSSGKHISTLRMLRRYGIQLHLLFSGPDKLPRTLAGRQRAATMLGLTEKQVRSLLPKTRSNERGHKPYSPRVEPTANAHDPFSLTMTSKAPKD